MAAAKSTVMLGVVRFEDANCTVESECPVYVGPPRFTVKATAEFHGQSRVVAPGDFVVIDPDAAPQDGSVVLVGSTLERWHGQPAIRGVAVEWMSVARL